MKLHRKEYPKIRERVKHGKSYFEVDMRRKGLVGRQYRTFTQLKDARKYAAEVAKKASLSGLDSLGDMLNHRQDLELLNGLRQQCGHYGKSVQQAVSLALRTWEEEEETKKSPYTSELLTLWVVDKTEGLRNLRPKTLKSIRNMAEVFRRKWGEHRIKEITHPMVEDWLKGAVGGDYRKRNLLSNFSAFFRHIRKKKYYEGENPCDGLEIHITQTTPGFLTADQCRIVMAQSRSVEGVSPYIALGLFAGIRPEEVQRMDWSNIKLKTKEIFIQAAISKTKKDRLFKMPDNLVVWLTKYQDQPRLIPNRNMQNVMAKLKPKLPFRWKQDILRHTFATFRYAVNGHDLNDLRHMMGNSPSIIDKFYRGILSDDEVNGFWHITPD